MACRGLPSHCKQVHELYTVDVFDESLVLVADRPLLALPSADELLETPFLAFAQGAAIGIVSSSCSIIWASTAAASSSSAPSRAFSAAWRRVWAMRCCLKPWSRRIGPVSPFIISI